VHLWIEKLRVRFLSQYIEELRVYSKTLVLPHKNLSPITIQKKTQSKNRVSLFHETAPRKSKADDLVKLVSAANSLLLTKAKVVRAVFT